MKRTKQTTKSEKQNKRCDITKKQQVAKVLFDLQRHSTIIRKKLLDYYISLRPKNKYPVHRVTKIHLMRVAVFLKM